MSLPGRLRLAHLTEADAPTLRDGAIVNRQQDEKLELFIVYWFAHRPTFENTTCFMTDRPRKQQWSQRRQALHKTLVEHLLPDLCVLVDDCVGSDFLDVTELQRESRQSYEQFQANLPRYAEDFVDKLRRHVRCDVKRGVWSSELWYSKDQLQGKFTAYSSGIMSVDDMRTVAKHVHSLTEQERHIFQVVAVDKKYSSLDDLFVHVHWSLSPLKPK